MKFRMLVATAVLAAAGAVSADPLFGFVLVVGEGVPGVTHDDRGPHPLVIREGLLGCRIGCGRIEREQRQWINTNTLGVPVACYTHRGMSSGDIADLASYGIHHFIFENEPEYDLDGYIAALTAAYPVIKGADPSAVVIGGNLYTNQFPYLYDRGFKNVSDMVGFHCYSDDPATGINIGAAGDVHNTMVAYGDGDKPMYLGEGWGPKRELLTLPRLSPDSPVSAEEISQLRDFVVNGYRNITTPTYYWDPDWAYAVLFFTYNDNWGQQYVSPHHWNGGLVDIWGNAKDDLLDVFPGNTLSLANPGFEYVDFNEDPAVGALWDKRGGSPAGAYAVDGSVRHHGTRSQRMTIVTPGRYEYVKQLTVRGSAAEGSTYTVSAWVRTRDLAGLGARVALQFYASAGGPVGGLVYSDPVSGDADWTLLSASAVAPPGTGLVLVMARVDGDAGTAWFDDVCVWQGTVPTAGGVPQGSVSGYVMDTDNSPISGATVECIGGGYTAVTDGTGHFQMPSVDCGVYDFRAGQAGYGSQVVTRQIVPPGRNRALGFNLDPVSPTAPSSVRAMDPVIGGTIHVTWEAPTGPVDHYHVYRSTSAFSLGSLVHDNVTATEVWDGGVTDGTAYWYTVRSWSSGTGESTNDDRHVGVSTAGPGEIMYQVQDNALWSPSFFGNDYGQTFQATVDGYLTGVSLFVGYGGGQPGTITYTIHDGGPGGPQIGPARYAYAPPDQPVSAHWNVGEVPIQAGHTYYVHFYNSHACGVYRRDDVYAGGSMYFNGSPVSYRDMWGTYTAVKALHLDITDVRSSEPVAGRSVVTWRTNAPATSQVEYGPDEGYGYTTVLDPTPTVEHRVVVADAQAGWHFRVVSTRTGLRDEYSLDYVFGDTDLVTALSERAFAAGWALFSFPLVPPDAEASAALDDLGAAGNVIDTSLWSYTQSGGYKLYSKDWTAVEVGRAYWLWVQVPATETLRGGAQVVDAVVDLQDGWNMVGMPLMCPVSLADCLLSDGSQVKTFDEAVSAGWVQPTLYYYDGGYLSLRTDGTGDDDTLRPWTGYWMLVHRGGLRLIVPVPAAGAAQ